MPSWREIAVTPSDHAGASTGSAGAGEISSGVGVAWKRTRGDDERVVGAVAVAVDEVVGFEENDSRFPSSENDGESVAPGEPLGAWLGSPAKPS